MKNETQLISESGTTQTILLKWFWQFSVKSSIFLLVIAMVFMAIEGSMMGLLSYSVKILFDDVFLSGAAQDILNVGAIIFLIFSTRAASGFFQRSIVSFVGQKILAQLQSQLVFHLLKLDSKFFYENAPGLLIERVRGDSQKVIEMLSLVFMTVGRDGVTLFSLIFCYRVY
jgi:ABC-type multidrug transport system, ATPase and permease components